MSNAIYSGGFADPVFAAQATFRKVLDAMSRPGKIIACEAQSRPPKPLNGLCGGILATLADADTPVFLSLPMKDTDPAANWLRFHTGAPVIRDPALAAFAVVTDMKFVPPFTQFPQGTSEYPDRSTTLILQVESLTEGDEVLLSGPGIKGEQSFAPKGLPMGFWQQVKMNNAQYPRGLDLLFVSADAIAALPCSTKIQFGES